MLETQPSIKRQILPTQSQNSQIVLDYVIDDLLERSKHGEIKYGSKLMTFNGRKSLVDVYEEVCDLIVYLKQYLMEQEELNREKDCTE